MTSRRHVDFVGILFIVWGALTALVGLSTLALGVGAASLASSMQFGGGHVAAGLTAAAFITLAGIAIIWGLGHVLIGVPLRRHRPGARLLAIDGRLDRPAAPSVRHGTRLLRAVGPAQ